MQCLTSCNERPEPAALPLIRDRGVAMGETTLIHLSRLIALERKLDATAQNVANANTTGFRARQLSFREYLKPEKGVDEAGKRERPLSLTDPRFQFTNVSQGAIERTDNPLDIAINGDGYLVVQTAQGERYTRNGALMLDGSGRILTLDGEPVLGKNGPLQVPANERDISVSPDGVVSTRQRSVGQLRVVSFARPEQLLPAGSSLLRSEERPRELAAGKINLISGAVEKSNVESVHEMSRLSEITRSYEMVGKLLKGSQDADDINKLANVPE